MKWQSLVPEFPRLRTKGGWKIQTGAKLARATWISKSLGKRVWGCPITKRGPAGVSLPHWFPQWLQQLQGALSLLPAVCQREEPGAGAGEG